MKFRSIYFYIMIAIILIQFIVKNVILFATGTEPLMFRDWEDYVTHSDEITVKDVYNEMRINACKKHHLRKGVYFTSAGKRGTM